MGTLKIGQLLISRGLLHPDHLSEALAEQQEVGSRLGMILVRRGFVEEETLIRTLAGQLKLPVARIRGKRVGPEVVECIPVDVAEKHRCLPLFFKQEGGARLLFVAMEDPSDEEALAEIATASGHDVRAVLVGPTELEEAIQRHYHWTEMTGESPDWEREAALPDADPAAAGAAPGDLDPQGAEPAAALDLAAPDEGLAPDFDPNWRADADAPGDEPAAIDPEPLHLAELGGAITTPDLGDDLEADLDADLATDLGVEGEAAPGDADAELDFDPHFQLDLPDPPPVSVAIARPEALDPRIILRALSQLLVEKGVISREEFVERLSQIAAREGSGS